MKTSPFLSKVLISVFFLALLLMVSTCSKSDEKTVVAPSLTTKTPSSITATTADVGGYVSSDGGASVTERGVCYSTNQTPTFSDFVVVEGGGTGNFQCTLSGLDPSTKYYARAYALNSAGTGYGNQVSFTTLTSVGLPTVTTSAITNITQNSAQGGGNVTNDGGSQVTQKGVCWSTSQNPTISDNYTTDGSGTGSLTSDITGLTPSTKYYIRAYATNNVGTAYGSQISFTTTGGTGQIPTVTTSSITSITQTTATGGGNVTLQGSSTVTARGVCWSTSSNPFISDSHTDDGSGTGSFISDLTGLTTNKKYYTRAYATNSTGTAYGSQVSFTTLSAAGLPTVTTSAITNITQNSAQGGGNVTNDGGSQVTQKGVCWSTSTNPTISDNYTTDGSGTGIFISNITGLNANTPYYIRSYATNSIGTAYGNQLIFTTLSAAGLPTVTTSAITNITQNSAQGGGNVTNDGGSQVTQKGVCWSTFVNPTISDNYTADGSGTGSYTSDITGLTASTTYYNRAYATNSVGTAYGNLQEFTTTGGTQGEPCPGISTITDPRDGQVYPTVQIGTQCWLQKNMNYQTSNSWCYSNNTSNCTTYGRLYDWPTALGVCPAGWHLPSDAEWTTLTTFLGGEDIAGGKMKETGTSHWYSPNAGATNSSGFTALPSGYRHTNGSFYHLAVHALFWSSTEMDPSTYAWSRDLYYNSENVYRDGDYEPYGFSARCVRD